MHTSEPTVAAVHAARAVRTGVGRLRRKLRENYDHRELTASQTAVLGRLARSGPASASELAAAEGVRPQSIAMTISVLVERGFVTRDQDPNDGRRQLVSASPAGAELLSNARAEGEGWLARVFGERFTEAELATITDAMTLLERVTER